MTYHSFEKNLKYLDNKSYPSLLRGIKRGFEKECLRVDESGMLAKTTHPLCLGSSLMHPFVTTDFSESLLEFITPPTKDLNEPFQILTELHQFTYRCLENEFLWAASMPCHLPLEDEIPIAVFGSSNIGKIKYIYRKGLGFRYGKKMQTIAGIHYNFSLSEDFFKQYYQDKKSNLAFTDFVSEQYLGLIRNSLRFGFILPLLFGASPAICKNFVHTMAKKLDFLEEFKGDTFLGPYATSLRLSDLGYHNTDKKIQEISYNSLPEFLTSMHHSVHTRHPVYAKYGVLVDGQYNQLNDSILQIEDEHYAMVRPKRVSMPDERTLAAIHRAGIEYIEVRALDINPYLLLGVEPEIAYFIDVFLLTCLLLESPPIDNEEKIRIDQNLQRVVTQGRKPDLKLWNEENREVSLVNVIEPFFDLMGKSSQYLDKAYNIKDFTLAIKKANKSLKNRDLLPSARIVSDLKTSNQSYFDFIKYWSLKHKNAFQGLIFSPEKVQCYERLAKASLIDQTELEKAESTPFSEYLRNFLAP